MSEKLYVKNFAGIKELELEIGDVNILIGPQAAGKSICAKLLYYFKSFFTELFFSVETEESINDLTSRLLSKFKEFFPSDCIGSKKFKIKYEINNNIFEISNDALNITQISLNHSCLFEKELDKIQKEYKKRNFNNRTEPENEIGNIVTFARFTFESIYDAFGKPAGYRQNYVPAVRSFFTFFHDHIYSFLTRGTRIDPFLVEFGSLYENMKISKSKYSGKTIRVFENILTDILNGVYIQENKRDYILQNERKINLKYASSGQQEVLPIIIILENLLHIYYPGIYGNTIYIEEPEAHIFPDTQRKIIEAIAYVYNLSEQPVQFVITTHSPYILTSFNNLIQAGILESKVDEEKKKELYKIVPKEMLLKPEQVKAYSLDNGTAERIDCDDTGLIAGDLLDEVSEKIAIQFDQLLDLEYSGE